MKLGATPRTIRPELPIGVEALDGSRIRIPLVKVADFLRDVASNDIPGGQVDRRR